MQLLEAICYSSTIASGLGFSALVFGVPLSLTLSLLGGFVGVTLHYSIKVMKNKKVNRILTGFLQELQNSLKIDESDDQLSLEGVKELEGTKQRVLLKEKVKLQSGENLFDFNKRFKGENIDIPVYESGPKLKFGNYSHL